MARLVVVISAVASVLLLSMIYAQVANPASGGVAPSAGAAPSGDGETAGSIEITAFDLGFEPRMVEVATAGVYTVSFANTGSTVHDVTFDGGEPIVAQPGQTVTAQVAVPAEGIGFICAVPGHADGGMTGHVMVTGTAGDGGAPPDATVEKDPNAPAYQPRDASAPALLDGTVHDIDLYVIEQPMTVAEGFVQTVFAFGTSPETANVPGPVIRVKVGDTVRVHLKNPDTNIMPHSVDFHASLVAWNDEMTDINPGEEKLYEFKAEYAGVFMYHCGTAGALSHMLNGMYGLIIVEPAAGLAPVDREVFLVQNEWYLGPQGTTGDLTRANATVPEADFVVFNGIANQYRDNPIQVETGETVRAFVLNVGPNIDSSFHVVGTIFDEVIREGIHLKRGNEGGWGSQAVDLAPAQGAIVEFHFAEDGLYPIVTHAFNFVAHGALGLFQAGDGDPLN